MQMEDTDLFIHKLYGKIQIATNNYECTLHF